MSDHFSYHEPCCKDVNDHKLICLHCAGFWPCPTEQIKRQVVAKVLEIVERGSSTVERSIAEQIREL